MAGDIQPEPSCCFHRRNEVGCARHELAHTPDGSRFGRFLDRRLHRGRIFLPQGRAQFRRHGMTYTAIRVEQLSKSYRIARALTRQPYRTLQEEVVALPRTLWKRARGKAELLETLWALTDVSF